MPVNKVWMKVDFKDLSLVIGIDSGKTCNVISTLFLHFKVVAGVGVLPWCHQHSVSFLYYTLLGIFSNIV